MLTTAAITVPEGLRPVIVKHLEALSPEAQLLLAGASVVGEEFTGAAVAAGLQLDLEAAESQLEEVVATSFFIEELGLVRWPDGTLSGRYKFRHALYRQTLYEGLDAGRRARLHLRIGEHLEASYGARAETVVAELALHFELGHDGPRTVHYRLLAAETAFGRGAPLEVIRHCNAGLAWLPTLSETSERMQRELPLQVALGRAHMATKGYNSPEVIETYTRARFLCEQIGEPSDQFSVFMGLWMYHVAAANLHTAYELGQQCLRIAQREEKTQYLVDAHMSVGLVAAIRGALGPAHEALGQACASYEPGLVSHLSSHPSIASLGWFASVLQLLGYADQALSRLHDMVALAQQLADPYGYILAGYYETRLHCMRRAWGEAQQQGEALMERCETYGFTYWHLSGRALRGYAMAMQGQVETGLAQLYRSLEIKKDSGSDQALPQLMAFLAEAHLTKGDGPQGLEAINQGLDLVNKNDERLWEAELYRLKGELLRLQPMVDTAEPEACFVQALSLARQQGAKAWELRAAVSLARLWQEQGKCEAARTLIAPLYAWFAEGFETADLQEAKALLDALAG